MLLGVAKTVAQIATSTSNFLDFSLINWTNEMAMLQVMLLIKRNIYIRQGRLVARFLNIINTTMFKPILFHLRAEAHFKELARFSLYGLSGDKL